mmetsp:Transcript_40001/g.84021  ORF Transcript_40001/g.84021 Transcript_40001/m.84021 type:complete len:240 (+) Transcript_40001:1069-1788(+)
MEPIQRRIGWSNMHRFMGRKGRATRTSPCQRIGQWIASLSDVSDADWGSYIGFEMHPYEYLYNDYNQYYYMSTMASKNLPRENLLGPRYCADESDTVDSQELLPLFARLDFGKDPIDVQLTPVLRAHLLARGLTVPQNTSPDKLHQLVHSVHEVRRKIMDPTDVPEPAKWVGFEPLNKVEIGDKYDDWNNNYASKIRILKVVDDNYIGHHFGTGRAQYQQVTAFNLLNGGNIGLSTAMV